MISRDIYQAAQQLIPLVGFRQTVAKKEYLDLSNNLIPDTTLGQIYVNSLSELFLSVESMDNCLVNNDGYDVDTWDIGTPYIAGNRVRKTINNRAFTWVAVINNTGNDPETDDGTNWKSALSSVLDGYRESAAIELISAVLAKQNNESFSSRVRRSNTMYKESATPTAAQLKSRFVGVCIKPTNDQLNKVLSLDKIGLNLSGPSGSITFYLYHSSKNTAVKTFQIAYDNANENEHVWYDLSDIVIDTFDDAYNQGGVFYLGFYEDDLSGLGINYNFNELTWAGMWPVGRIDSLYNDQDFIFSSIEIENSRLNSPSLPNIGQYYDGVSYNTQLMLNLTFRIDQSYYPQIAKNIQLFQNAYRYALGFSILRDMMQSDRINRIADNAQAKIDELLYGDPGNDQNMGLGRRKESHMKALLADLDIIFDNYKGAYLGPI